MKKHAIVVLLFLIVSITTQAQHIVGKVLDSKTLEALPFANVFINNTTLGTVTDTNGEFALTSIKVPGMYELVFSFVGYETYKMKITVGESILKVGNIKLVPSEIQLNTVEVTATHDKEWEKKLKKFKKVFLGDDKLAASCNIINPWVIDFPQHHSRFLAKASAPIEIENNALGYRVIFYLTNFWSDASGYSIIGNAYFSELKSVDAQKIAAWQINRSKSYRQSTHHLFKSMIEHRIYGEGFSLYGDIENLKNAITRSSLFYSEVGKSVFAYDTSELVVPDAQPGYYKITLKGRVEVHDRKEKATKRIYQDVFGQVSWITLKNNQVIVNKDGFPKNPADVIVSGDMSAGRVASMLPLDYTPEQVGDLEKVNLSMYQEQPYIHTDKPYYYPGETIWFKGYMNYATPAWRDSLSKTIYVELVDRKKKSVIMTKTLEIVNGFFNNDFRLSDTLAANTYYLRAYTNFNRNFGDENLFIRPLPILNLTDKIKTVRKIETAPPDNLFTMVADKKSYNPREKITLTFILKDDDDNTLAGNFSVSVVDSAQVVPLETSNTIVNDYPIKEIEASQIKKDFPFAIEYGIRFSGKFLNESNKPEKATLNILQLNPNNFTMAQSDDEGLFSVGGFSFYDTATFSVQATRGKGDTYGRAAFVTNQTADIDFVEREIPLEHIKTEFPQRVLSDYENPREARMLEEVVIKSTKIEEQYQAGYRVKRPYGKPDYVIKAKDLNTSYGNLLQTLPGKVPGLIVREVTNNGEGTKWVVYLQRQMSVAFPAEVLVTVNDVIVAGSPASILGAIDPNTVESIEVKNGINVLYGSVGGNGIVAVYTKKEFEQVPNTKSLAVMKVPGYSRSRNFTAPDYSNPQTDKTKVDYRSTIYWNPNVVIDAKSGKATVSFFAADLPGKYRVVTEGVLQNGEAVRGVYFLDVASR